MPCQINYSEADGIVRAVYSGTSTKEDHLAILHSVMQMCGEKNSTKILVDFSGMDSSVLSTLDVFSIGEFIAKAKHVRHIAHVFPQHSTARNNIRFASNVEANRGKITKEFEKAEDAAAWLLSIP